MAGPLTRVVDGRLRHHPHWGEMRSFTTEVRLRQRSGRSPEGRTVLRDVVSSGRWGDVHGVTQLLELVCETTNLTLWVVAPVNYSAPSSW